MARKPRPWFRFYVEALHDRKLRRREPAERWLWVAVLGVARSSPEPGVLLIGTATADEADLADVAALPAKVVRSGVAYFLSSDAAMLRRREEDGALVVINWDRRQFESDDVTARTALHRSNQHRRNVPTSAEGTPPETETENRDNPPNPPSGDGGPETLRTGMRGTGTSPREQRAQRIERAEEGRKRREHLDGARRLGWQRARDGWTLEELEEFLDIYAQQGDEAAHARQGYQDAIDGMGGVPT